MMLGELCRKVDWSVVDQNHETWRKLHPSDYEPDPEFLFRWRSGLLESAINDTNTQRRLAVINELNKMGVWGQVLSILEGQGLLAQDFTRQMNKTGLRAP